MTQLRVFLWAAVLFTSGCFSHAGYVRYHHPLKHTWDCQLIAQPTGHVYWYMRPNHELFEVYWDNPPLSWAGAQFKDIAYTDDNADMRHFVKATLK
jgi:hypothetical protein